MRFICASIIICFISLYGCNIGNKKVSFSTINYHCEYTRNPIDITQPYFDTLQLFIKKEQPDLISFKESQFTKKCIDNIENEGYKFIPINLERDTTFVAINPVALKKTAFEFLASSYYLYNDDIFLEGKNVVAWYQLKNKSSGHIFYLFNLQLQCKLSDCKLEVIGFDLLKKIDQISAGLPVVLIGDFSNNNKAMKELLTDNWKNFYSLNEVKTSSYNSDFLVNDFFKIKGVSTGKSNDTLISNVFFKFSDNTGRISKNKNGKTIPEKKH